MKDITKKERIRFLRIGGTGRRTTQSLVVAIVHFYRMYLYIIDILSIL